MALAKQFSRKLDQLWHRRTDELRAQVVPRGAGKPPSFTKKVRQKLVDELLDLASTILIRRSGRAEFRATVAHRRLRFIRERGLLKRGKGLVQWAQRTVKGPIVYAFWRRRRCLYVGKGKSWRRLRSYEKSAYLLSATCVEVFSVRSKSQLGKAECLATHLFDPRDQRVRPARVKWGKACPICRRHDAVRDELRGLFRMR
ncbi:MAG: hypothetical protein L6Q99_03015 [Planctomycetes bacterium]|nr:hypothetical protein [Planctomycetota bacterium]